MIVSMCSNLRGVFISGTAGCVATLLHDAAMNPAEGKGSTFTVQIYLPLTTALG